MQWYKEIARVGEVL